MCGICGIYNFNKDHSVSEAVLNDMNTVIAHRGPDGSGLFIKEFIGLGHRRLSIIDLANGKQPMSNEDNTIWVTYNGEIYNYIELREDLIKKGHRFTTNCDTEVIVHSYEEYGTDCILKFNGMFSFALWDEKNEMLFLARDRLGVKPLYYTISNGTLIFASEIKAILKHPEVKKEIETNSVPEYLLCTALLEAKTMFKNIYSLPAGYKLVFKNNKEHISQYWDMQIENTRDGIFPFSQYKNETLELIKDSVRMRLMSDVPFGSLLSGGLDSSLISAVATKYVSHRLKTFAMEYDKNSSITGANSDTFYSNMMADTFKTQHKEFILKPEDYHSILQKVIWHVEKPVELTTPSVYLLYQKLSCDVKVVLSGEGADELFGGYFFFLQNEKDGRLKEFPWAPYLDDVSKLLDQGVEEQTVFKDRIRTTLDEMMNKVKSEDYLNKVLYLFVKLYLLEMLERQDKTSMAWGVESRVPFLDYRLVEYASNVPSKYKMKGDIEKFILKEVGREVLPSQIVDRKKKPFPFPIDAKSMLNQKNIAKELVESGNSKISNYFNKKAVNNFFDRKDIFESVDSLAIFRTSYAMISLETWHRVFGV